jgi:hypothetical protein
MMENEETATKVNDVVEKLKEDNEAADEVRERERLVRGGMAD